MSAEEYMRERLRFLRLELIRTHDILDFKRMCIEIESLQRNLKQFATTPPRAGANDER